MLFLHEGFTFRNFLVDALTIFVLPSQEHLYP